MPELLLPHIAANLFDANETCSFCGYKLAALDLIGKTKATACVNRNCQFRYCSCFEDYKKGVETVNCPVHWKCACREGYLCGRHSLRPELVQTRFKLKGKEWADSTGFSTIHAQAMLWVKACKEQEQKALAHCGNCFSALVKDSSHSPVNTTCPNGCKCNCGTAKACHVHMTCGCLQGFDLCQFHKTKKPEILVALYRALPPTKLRTKLVEKMYRAGIDHTTYPQRGRRPKELDIKDLVRKAGLSVAAPVVKVLPPTLAKKQAVNPEPLQVIAPQAVTPAITTAKAREVKTPKASITKIDLANDLQAKVPAYRDWLAKQGLSPHSTRNYLSRINAFIDYLKETDYPALSPATKDLAIRDFKKHLQKNAKLKPATVNSYLAAIDNFYSFLGLGKTSVSREDLPQEAPQSLTPKDQKIFLRAIELTRRTKDRAIATLLFYTGMRLSECANLELDDIFVVGRKTRAIIRSGKGSRYREVPLNSLVCEALQAWLTERSNKYASKSVASAVFLNPQGKPMLPNSIYEAIRKIGRDAGLELSPHTLRHTCLTALVRKQNDIILVADIAGHKSLNTTRRYTLPTAADKAKALEGLLE